MMLTFFTNPMSRGRIIRWMLEEVGAPYETMVTQWGSPDPALLAANPLGKVPTIIHDGVVVSGTAAICAYLAEAFPDTGLAPRAEERASYYRWMFFTAGPVEAAMMDSHLGVTLPPEKEAMIGYGNLARAVDVLEGAVSAHDYIAGPRFTAADVYVGSSVDFFIQFGMLEKREAFARYLDRLRDRPAWVRARAIDDALIAAAER
ncbi:glutathione S-transferase family protein [Sphingomonas sp. RHCKR47]|uniref:glutathione S-transferase family protein n=1 Tax=Sphingomonas citricola TaxID=2862498 RepID=UPI001C6849B1|nr:glutathione S-transferase family protein [Sphingomonas citricola]MBW6522854.1 glutathione S-transferase family protein [Sphingomonas citricola]